MYRVFKQLLIFMFFAGVLTGCSVKYSSFGAFLDARSEFTSTPIEVDSFYESAYLLWVEQSLDHSNPSAGTFLQRVWLSHKGVESPVVLITEGYSAPLNYLSELARLLEANQIVVEHRFFGESVQGEIPWEYLTVAQAAKDHQRIVELFKRVYQGKWITTGISKGGQAALIHRAYFPRSVDATVTYVAPFNIEREDYRLIAFFEEVGTPVQRKFTRDFQVEVLKRRDDILPMFEAKALEKKLTFKMGLEIAFELSVLEYPFSYWQWCVPSSRISPSSATSRELFEHLNRGIDFSYFSDQDTQLFGPFFYQAYKELGYYGYDAAPLLPYLKAIRTSYVSSEVLVPDKVKGVEFDESVAADLLRRIRKSDPRIIHITGRNDPWSATSPDITGLKNSHRIENPEGCHLTRIGNMPDSLRTQVKMLLENWVIGN